MENNKVITIFGGSGFIGQYTVKHLVERGFIVKIITTNLKQIEKFKVEASSGRINCIYGNIFDINSLPKFIENSYGVINLVSSFDDKDKSAFTYLHAQFPEIIAKISKKFGIQKFIHLSSLNVEHIDTLYAKSRLLGEKAVQAAFENAIIIKSGIIFGEEDKLINTLYSCMKNFHIIPLVGDGSINLQPLYVGDLANAISLLCQENSNYSGVHKIAGTEIFSLKEMYSKLEKIAKHKIYFIPTSKILLETIVEVFSFKIMSLFNKIFFGSRYFPLLPEQIKFFSFDSVIENPNDNLINKLNIKAHSLKKIISRYLTQ